jgi:phosphoribosylglycinamide formyltransferase-1
MKRLGLLASGRGSNVDAILTAIDGGRLEMNAAVLICDRAAGAEDVARRHGVPVSRIERHDHPSRAAQSEAIRDALREAGVDIVALAGYAAVLDPVVVDAFAGRILNIHPSLLPSFAGSVAPEPQAAALRAGVKLAGCTVHVVTAEVDAGPIVAQAAVAVLPGDSVETLSARILAAEHRLFPTVLQWFAGDRVTIKDGIASVTGAEESQAPDAPGRSLAPGWR